MIVFICSVQNKRHYIITTGAQKEPNKTSELKKENIAKQYLDKGVSKDYADEDDGEDDYEDYSEEEINEGNE